MQHLDYWAWRFSSNDGPMHDITNSRLWGTGSVRADTLSVERCDLVSPLAGRQRIQRQPRPDPLARSAGSAGLGQQPAHEIVFRKIADVILQCASRLLICLPIDVGEREVLTERLGVRKRGQAAFERRYSFGGAALVV